MSKPISSHDKFACMLSELFNVTTHINLTIESHQEIINKIKHIRAIGIGARANELKKIMRIFLLLMAQCTTFWITQDTKVTSTIPNNRT